MKKLFRATLCDRPFGGAVLHVPTLLKWAENKSLSIPASPPLADFDFVQVEAALCAIEAHADEFTESDSRAIVSANPRLANYKYADVVPAWLIGADAHKQWREIFTKATEAGELQLLDPVSHLPITPAPAHSTSAPADAPASEGIHAGAGAKPNDWREDARQIADECFDHDTTQKTRDCLLRKNSRGDWVGGYAYRTMEIMQERKIHGPRGLIDNAGTVSRDALQGDLWWAKKSK